MGEVAGLIGGAMALLCVVELLDAWAETSVDLVRERLAAAGLAVCLLGLGMGALAC